MTLIGSIVQSLRSFSRARAERSSEDAVHHTSAHTQPSHDPQFCSLLVIFTLTVNTGDLFIYLVSNLSVHTFWCASSWLSRRVSRCSLCLAGWIWHRFFWGECDLLPKPDQNMLRANKVHSPHVLFYHWKAPCGTWDVLQEDILSFFLINVLPNSCPDYFDLVSGHLIRQKLLVWLIHLEFVCFSVVSSRFSSFFPQSNNT